MGLEQVDAWIRRLKALAGGGIAARVAAKAAPLVDEALKKTIRAGTTPAGAAWAPMKRGGGRPLANAASQVTTKASGAMIVATLTGPAVFHDQGTAHAPRRQVLPETGETPPAAEQALERAARETFDEVMRGGR